MFTYFVLRGREIVWKGASRTQAEKEFNEKGGTAIQKVKDKD
jgi:hypothetical protein